MIRAALALLALLGGFAAARLVPAPTLPHTPPTRSVAPPCPELSPLVVEVETDRREIGAVEAELVKGSLAEADAVGLPVEWPEDLPPQFTETAVDAALTQALGGPPFALDCSEYPCIATVVVDFVDGPPMGRANAASEQLEAVGYDVWQDLTMRQVGDRMLLVTTWALVSPDAEFPELRKQYRFDEMKASVEPAVAELAEAAFAEAATVE